MIESRTSRRSLSAWFAPGVLALFVMAGFIKGAPGFELLPVDLTLLLAGITVGMITWRVLRTGAIPRAAYPASFGPLVFLLAALWAPPIAHALDKGVRLGTFTLLAAVAPALLLRHRDDLRRLEYAWAGTGLLVVALAAAFPLTQGEYAGSPLEGPGTTIGLGRAGGILLLVVAQATMQRTWLMPFWGLLTLAAAGAMLASGARGPLVAAAASLVVGLILDMRRSRRLRAFLALALVGVSLALLYSFAPEASQVRIYGLLSGDIGSSGLTRVHLYGLAWDAFLQRPLGLGLGGYVTVAPSGYLYPHNLLLEVLAEGGLFVFTLFGAWLAWVFRASLRARHDFVGSVAFSLLTFTAMNAMFSGDVNSNRLLFLATGMCLAAARLQYPSVDLGRRGLVRGSGTGRGVR